MNVRRLSEQEKQLFDAARMGNATTIKKLIAEHVNVNVISHHKPHSTPLHHAAQEGHANAVQTLIDANANIHHECSNGDTALHFAAQNGHLAVIHVLLTAGADPNHGSNRTRSPLYLAAAVGDAALWKKLLQTSENSKHGIMIDNEFIHQHRPLLDTKTSLNTIKALIRAGAMVGYIPLNIAARLGRVQTVDMMLDEMIKKAIQIEATDMCYTYWEMFVNQLEKSLPLQRPSSRIIHATLNLMIQNTPYPLEPVPAGESVYRPLIEILNELTTFKLYETNKGFRADLRDALAKALDKKFLTLKKEMNPEKFMAELHGLNNLREHLTMIQGPSKFTAEKTAMTTIKKLINFLDYRVFSFRIKKLAQKKASVSEMALSNPMQASESNIPKRHRFIEMEESDEESDSDSDQPPFASSPHLLLAQPSKRSDAKRDLSPTLST